MNNINNFTSIEQMTGNYLGNKPANEYNKHTGASFLETLQSVKKDNSDVVFSKHASERLKDRNIEMTKEQLDRLSEGTKRAYDKGINESLVLLDDMAFIVNTKNNTVITAMNSKSQDENIYTNIDGAVII